MLLLTKIQALLRFERSQAREYLNAKETSVPIYYKIVVNRVLVKDVKIYLYMLKKEKACLGVFRIKEIRGKDNEIRFEKRKE